VIVLAVASAGCFLGLAHAAVRMPVAAFRRMTLAMAITAVCLAVVSPAAAAALLAPVLLSRCLAIRPIPATVDELLRRR